MAETTTLKVLREAVAGQLGLLVASAITVDADPVFTLPTLADKSPDSERLRDAYLYQSGTWKRIVSIDATGAIVTVTGLSAIVVGAAEVYLMLDPDEMNAAINESLKELYYVETETISIVANTYIYTLPTWLQTKGQLMSVRWRDISLLTTQPREEEVNSYGIIEDANALKIYIHDVIRSVTTYDIQVKGRRNYSALATDAATTTCPYPLIFNHAMVKVIHKLFNKYGKGVASLFGQKMAVAEKDLMVAKSDWLPKIVAREYVEEESWQGIDSNPYFESPPW